MTPNVFSEGKPWHSEGLASSGSVPSEQGLPSLVADDKASHHMARVEAKKAAMQTLTEGGYEMLRAAVNAARQFQCQNVRALKGRLLLTYPSHESDINEAIDFWAASVRERYPNGVPNQG